MAKFHHHPPESKMITQRRLKRELKKAWKEGEPAEDGPDNVITEKPQPRLV